MSTFKDWEFHKNLSKRGDTNSVVHLLKKKDTDEFIVRKTIYGINQPLYQAVFTREMRALYKLNKCSNIVQILGDDKGVTKNTREPVGVIYLEYIKGIELGKMPIEKFNVKEKFSIIKQLLDAIKISHSNGIIHRDINPNNIMITEDKNVKVIDFGICKIKDMINSSTVYKLGTTAYSAPEVHQHSENATEKSDLYSIGALIYYLFTGQQPPIATQFQNILNTAGMDISLKPIIKKLVAENPEERYNNIFDLENDFNKLFKRFLDSSKIIILTAASEKIRGLKNLNLVPKSANIKEACESYISNNFLDLYSFYNDNGKKYIFLGINYLAECIFDDLQNTFDVTDFKKIFPIDRENLKKKYVKIEGSVKFIDKRFAHKESKNDNLEVGNIIVDYYQEYISKNNVNYEYKSKYGVWRDLLNLLKKDIEENVVRLPYESYEFKDNIFRFKLQEGTFIEENLLNQEQFFIYERNKRKNNGITQIMVGSYLNDVYKNGHIILEIKKEGNAGLPPKQGSICLDYRKELINVDRQLDALNILEREDYQCSFNLKRIISGVDEPSVSVISKNRKMINNKLDFSQSIAVKKALDSDSVAIIQGPPGTGKTNVIIEIISQILKENKKNPAIEPKKILLVSQSHTAVDKMLEDLIPICKNGIDLIRIGKDEKLNPEIRKNYSINDIKEKQYCEIYNNCDNYMEKSLEKLGIKKEEFSKYYSSYEKSKINKEKINVIERKYIENFQRMTNGVESSRIRKILEIQQEWKEQIKQCNEVELYAIKSAVIIAGTCMGFLSNRVIRDIEFDYVIVDEAAKATFPELAVSLNKANRIILVGDHKQLPPVLDTDVIKNNKDRINRNNLSETFFEKLYNMFPENNKHRLTVQYRMHPVIGTLISCVFYDNEIQNGVEAEERDLKILGYEDTVIEWISTSKYPFSERQEKNRDNSYLNNLEKNIIEQKLSELDSKLYKKTKIAVITGYGLQKYILQIMVKKNSFKNIDVEVDTVDAFQGSQKEIIIYSTVRSSLNPASIGFLKSEARINVAFSRAKCLLIIVGDLNFLNNRIRGSKFPEIIDYIKNSNNCRIIE